MCKIMWSGNNTERDTEQMRTGQRTCEWQSDLWAFTQ